MKQTILTLLTRTPLHVGAGSSVGAIDQPVVRERHTRIPVIPGSSLKGVLADLFHDPAKTGDRTDEAVKLFGSDDPKNARAGKLLIGEAKLLAFPVRSAKGCFAWLTCPLALNRFQRDSGKSFRMPEAVDCEKALVTNNSELKLNTSVILEEYPLTVSGAVDPSVIAAMQDLCTDAVWQELPKKLAIVSDELFAYFCEQACEIAQHIRIDDEKGVVAKGALFNQENVPSESLFYTLVQAHDGAHLATLSQKLADTGNLLQIGADATTGLGWCSVKMS